MLEEMRLSKNMQMNPKEEELAREVFEDALYEDLEYIEGLLTIEDLASHTRGYNRSDFEKLIKTGELKSIKADDEILIEKEDFAKWYSEEFANEDLEIIMFELEDEYKDNDDLLIYY